MPEMVNKVLNSHPSTSSASSNLTFETLDPPSSRPIGVVRLMLLALCMILLIILIVYLAVISLSSTHVSTYGKNSTRNGSKRRGKPPPPLDLNRDLEAQPRPERPHTTFGYSATPTSSLGSWGSHLPSAVASGVDSENLTSPMRLRQLAPRGGDRVGEVSPLGLGRYFFEGGVGIKRYTSRGEELSWEDV